MNNLLQISGIVTLGKSLNISTLVSTCVYRNMPHRVIVQIKWRKVNKSTWYIVGAQILVEFELEHSLVIFFWGVFCSCVAKV